MESSSLEKGLKHLGELWRQKGDMVLNQRLESILNKEFLIQSDSEVYTLEFKKKDYELRKGENLKAHAVIEMAMEDWEKVLKGEHSIQSIIIAGRCPYFKHQRQFIMQLSMVAQVLLLL